MRRFIILFGCILLLAYGIIYLPPVRSYAIGPFTESITYLSGWLIQIFGGAVQVSANMLTINPSSADRFSVLVLDMCNGVEATVFLWAAMLAFPAPIFYKIKGLLLGTFTVHFLNIIRIISLVYLGAYKPAWFHWVHWYVWDALIMLDILIVFLAWIRLMPIRQKALPGETSFV